MNKYTDQQIEEKLKQFQAIEPCEDSLRRMNRRVISIIADHYNAPAKPYGFWYYALTSAAILLIGIGLLYNMKPITTHPVPHWTIPAEPTLTLAQMNAVFENGGQKSLDEYFDKAQTQRQPRAENVTLHEMLEEL